jgi:hypothetical protein
VAPGMTKLYFKFLLVNEIGVYKYPLESCIGICD